MSELQTNCAYTLPEIFCIFKEPIKTTMNGYVPVEFPTKRYIAAYIRHVLGDKPVMKKDSTIGSKMFDLLQHSTDDRKTEFSTRYNAKIKIYIPYRTFCQRGGYINSTNVMNFNLYVEAEIKDKYRTLMNVFIESLPSFEANLPQVRKAIGINEDSWDYESIKKDYYRYRKRNGLPPLYYKN